ncbi:GNAT family N-acetyltransferase [Tenggerimyces flavus]|uniref:GNAT family N-acetyltransferase n=1 Tax=Tenggerimyces flavus TaxID=1708749 RepID=A0ABV7YJU9_9ACTN|nr:GNAT family N-acetyltransferase [Tenggerimyces flavus]MBM7784144.1 ribosomal protein S18 acetylase RimI-like enzyme [Tenggerimyces flavus]
MSVEIRPFGREYADGVVALAQAEGWPTFSDAERVTRLLTAPGVVGLVAVQNDKVVGAAQLLTDGHQAYLAILVVAAEARGQGIGKRLIEAGFQASKAVRMDLLSTPESEEFYRRFTHREITGLRLFQGAPREAGDSEPGLR